MKAKAQCYDVRCSTPAVRELLGLRMCDQHYIEALEHSAHLVFVPQGKIMATQKERMLLSLRPLKEILTKRVQEKKASEEWGEKTTLPGNPNRFDGLPDPDPDLRDAP